MPSAPPNKEERQPKILRKDLDPNHCQLCKLTLVSRLQESGGHAPQDPGDESQEAIISVHVAVCICHWITGSGILKNVFGVSDNIAVSTLPLVGARLVPCSE